MIRHWLVFAASLTAIAAGAAYAVCGGGTAVDAQRGGSVAVALTFLMLFLDRPTSQRLIETGPDTASAGVVAHNALAAFLDQQAKARWPLALSSVLGTLAAGFGDLAVRALGVP